MSLRAAQALALTEERSYCLPDDVKRLVVPVFAHRITVSSRYSSAMRRSEEAEAVLLEIMKTIGVPLKRNSPCQISQCAMKKPVDHAHKSEIRNPPAAIRN